MFDQIILLVVLLVLSGFFSSAETALFSISKAKAQHLAKKQDKTYLLIAKMKENSHTLLSTILIGNNVVNVGAASLATAITMNLYSHNAVSIATGIMTFLILIFGEIIPKSIATRNNILVAKIVIIPIYWLSFLFFPIIKILDFIPLLTGKIHKTPAVTEEELLTIVDVVEGEGEIKKEEKEFIRNIFEFDDINASEIMTPRADMFVIEVDKNLNIETVLKSGFTRIPVIQESIDHVVGIVHIRDIFEHSAISNKNIDVGKIMHKPYFIPENKKLNTLLRQFKKRKQHMAIVIDEYGGVAGLATLEDVIEEIVGEISDETDKVEPHIVQINDEEWIVLGKTDIDEINQEIPINIPESKDYDTFSGYILERIEKIPHEKEKIIVGEFTLSIKIMEGNRISEVIIKKKSQIDKT